jgi:flavin reductase (DIM6/NTAB) family NADH-FMN oxidoreductase RutF
VDIDPQALSLTAVYKLLIGCVVPRPIAWVSTVDAAGVRNVAPFSYFMAITHNPPTVAFSSGPRGGESGAPRGEKDTLRNVQATGEFVVNIVSEPLAQAMNISATEFPPDVNEFQAAGLTPAPSVRVRPPRVAESQVHFECALTQVVTLGEGPGSGSVVIGRIVYLHVSDEVLFGGDKISLEKLRPIGRLGGHWYTRVTDVFEMVRPPAPSASK